MPSRLSRSTACLALITMLATSCAPDDSTAPPSQESSVVAAPTGSPAAIQGWPITGLGVLGTGTFSGATDLNAATTVVGYSAYDFGGDIHAFRWTSGTGMSDLGTLAGAAFGSFQSSAQAINDNEEIVGWSDAPHGGIQLNRAFFWSPASGMVELPSDTNYEARAYDISNAGVVIGCGVLPGQVRPQVLRWRRNAKGTWVVAGMGEPAAAGGQACGYGINAGANFVGYYPPGGFPITGFQNVAGTYTTLGTGTKASRVVGSRFVGAGGITGAGGVLDPGAGLPWEWPSFTAAPFSLGYLYLPGGEASDLNGNNHVVGTIAGSRSLTNPPYTRAFYWDCAGGMVDLGSLFDQPFDAASAAAINIHDVVAGTSNHFAVIWGVTPTANSVVPLPFSGDCKVPPFVSYIPKKFLNDGIISRPGFDATLIDPNTVTISDGFGHVTPIARTIPPGPPVFVLKDINGDGMLDMQVSFSKAQMIADGTLTPQSFQLVVSWVDATGLPQSGKYPIRVR